MAKHSRTVAFVAVYLGLLTHGVVLRGEPSSPAAATQPASQAASQPASQPVDAKAVAALVQQLADDRFRVREEATKKLIALGPAVVPLLKDKAKEKGLDAESSQRLQTILNTLTVATRPSRTEVTDAATGTLIRIAADGGIEAFQNGQMRWKYLAAGVAPTELQLENGQVIVKPGSLVLEVTTGRILSRP